jgi:hypothetical protein
MRKSVLVSVVWQAFSENLSMCDRCQVLEKDSLQSGSSYLFFKSETVNDSKFSDTGSSHIYYPKLDMNLGPSSRSHNSQKPCFL